MVDETSPLEPTGNPYPALKDQDTSSSSHEIPMEPRAKVEPGEHRIFTHFPKDRNCDICMRTKMTRGNFGDLIAADHPEKLAEVPGADQETESHLH